MMPRALVAMALAYVLPGAGHFYLGLRRRAAAFFLIVLFMFVVGVVVDGTLYTLKESHGQVLTILASLGSMGSGAFYFLANAMGSQGSVTSTMFEYGRTFTLTAGLMNLLLVLDCFDIVKGRKP